MNDDSGSVYRAIYDKQISLKQFQEWLSKRLTQSYEAGFKQGVEEVYSSEIEHDLGKSQYD